MPRLSKAEKERCHREILEIEQAKIKPYLDRIADLEKKNKVLTQNLEDTEIINKALEKENAELKSIADFQTSSNMDRHFQLKRSKKLLKQWLSLCGFKVEKLAKDTEQFLNSEVAK